MTVRNNKAFGHGSMVSFNTSQLFHDDSNGCWVLLELTFIASAVVTRMRMRCYGHMAHGTSPLYTSVRSLRDLHSLGPSALGCVNSVETCTSVYNLYLLICSSLHLAKCIHMQYHQICRTCDLIQCSSVHYRAELRDSLMYHCHTVSGRTVQEGTGGVNTS